MDTDAIAPLRSRSPTRTAATAVVLYGSRARGDVDVGSDVDVLCIRTMAPRSGIRASSTASTSTPSSIRGPRWNTRCRALLRILGGQVMRERGGEGAALLTGCARCPRRAPIPLPLTTSTGDIVWAHKMLDRIRDKRRRGVRLPPHGAGRAGAAGLLRLARALVSRPEGGVSLAAHPRRRRSPRVRDRRCNRPPITARWSRWWTPSTVRCPPPTRRWRVKAVAALFLIATAAGAGRAETIPVPDGARGIGFDDIQYAPGLKRILVPAGRTGRLVADRSRDEGSCLDPRLQRGGVVQGRAQRGNDVRRRARRQRAASSSRPIAARATLKVVDAKRSRDRGFREAGRRPGLRARRPGRARGLGDRAVAQEDRGLSRRRWRARALARRRTSPSRTAPSRS